MKNKKKFLFVVKQTAFDTNMKSKMDETIAQYTKWSDVLKKLRDVNRGMIRGLAYVKFEQGHGAS